MAVDQIELLVGCKGGGSAVGRAGPGLHAGSRGRGGSDDWPKGRPGFMNILSKSAAVVPAFWARASLGTPEGMEVEGEGMEVGARARGRFWGLVNWLEVENSRGMIGLMGDLIGEVDGLILQFNGCYTV